MLTLHADSSHFVDLQSLPFAELIDWDTIAVVVEVHQVSRHLKEEAPYLYRCHWRPLSLYCKVIEALLLPTASFLQADSRQNCTILWALIALGVFRLQIGTLLNTIRSFDVAQAQAQLQLLRDFWTFEHTNSYIVRRLQTEHIGLPLAKAAWSDDLGCDCAPGCNGRCS